MLSHFKISTRVLLLGIIPLIVEQIANANLSICAATEQQQQVSGDIAHNIHALNADIVQLSATAERASDASGQLNTLASQLNSDWQVFATHSH
jgi:methyl-accepting chemotaxis protein